MKKDRGFRSSIPPIYFTEENEGNEEVQVGR